LSLKKKIKNEQITIKNKKYLYISSFDAEDIFVGYFPSEYHPVYLTYFFAVISPDIREKLLEEAGMIKEQKVEIEKIKEQEAYIEAKNSINNMVKIK